MCWILFYEDPTTITISILWSTLFSDFTFYLGKYSLTSSILETLRIGHWCLVVKKLRLGVIDVLGRFRVGFKTTGFLE